ncbi:YicC/YloC family endoribonuclease [Actibacterium sp.]|uniref:YicC/YloC family endoribonuclease n=1 Tax=Actibacterium sp. TaxID=1872125 RepID=UPI003567420D
MTGFAAGQGGDGAFRWAWDIRSVNAKGLDLRLRLPDWIAGLEQAVRTALTARIGRGNVSLNLRISREAGAEALPIDEAALTAALLAVRKVEQAALELDFDLRKTSAADVLAMRGVQQAGQADQETGPLMAAIMADLPALIDAFNDMRAREGVALKAVLLDQLATIETLVAQSADLAAARLEQTGEVLRANLARVLENTDGADPDRVAQELVMLAVKADVREELDRLTAHIGAARDLLEMDGPVGRKLDFLMQEFNREANTLCSKSQSADLTRIGLDLKATIDQMREQVQNVE